MHFLTNYYGTLEIKYFGGGYLPVEFFFILSGFLLTLKTSNVNTHMLRHTFATRCIESGMTAVALSKLLGHSDIDTTLNTYTSVFNQFKEKEVDKYISYLSGLH